MRASSMRRVIRWVLAAAGAGTAIYLTSSYLVRPEGVSKDVAGPLRFIPGSSGPGIDDLAYGGAALLGGAVGNTIGRMLLGGK